MTNPSRGELVPGAQRPICNQCDGCQAGKPIEKNGCHRMGREGGYPDFMSCQASKYKNQEQSA
ncbi:hypothetical protein M1D96_06430 [Pseudomonas sp. D1-3]